LTTKKRTAKIVAKTIYIVQFFNNAFVALNKSLFLLTIDALRVHKINTSINQYKIVSSALEAEILIQLKFNANVHQLRLMLQMKDAYLASFQNTLNLQLKNVPLVLTR